MADPTLHRREGMFQPHIETDRLIGATGLAEKVVNLAPTPEGSLRTISGPAMLVDEADIELYGIGHCVVGGKELIVRQTVDRLQAFAGWEATKWFDITDPAGAAGTLEVDLTISDAPKYPAVFIPTPGGLIIIPAGNPRALFYDGEVIEYLGFSVTPGAPTLRASNVYDSATLSAVSVVADPGSRVGVVNPVTGSTTNVYRRERVQYEAVVQLIDGRGDLSPLSARSARVDVPSEVIVAGNVAEAGLFRLTWYNITTGPKKTLGRILGRTRSLTTSGTAEVYEVPQHSAPASEVLCTIPDNLTTFYSDNTPESALFVPMLDVAPVPTGAVAVIAMGRLWIATAEGALWFSESGRWGTFQRTSFLFPDIAAGEVTGMLPAPGGLVVCTTGSTFFITPNEKGDGFRSAALSSRYGCIAPGSMGMLPDGRAIWLDVAGFVQLRAGVVTLMDDGHGRLMRQLNSGRLVQATSVVHDDAYHCWVARDDARTPNLCLVYDGRGWRRRTDVEVRGACLTDDYRRYPLLVGKDANSARTGVLVLDHESSTLGAQTHTAELETAWVSNSSVNLKSVRRLIIWGRETNTQDITVEIMRDWREGEIIDTVTVPMAQPEDEPYTWANAQLGASGVNWERRRPFFGVVDLDIPSAQAVKFRFKATSNMDFIGFELQTQSNVQDGSWA
jgi:hypothetical protein